MGFAAFLLQLLSHLMTSAALCQTSWLGGCRSWSCAASWAPLPPGCLCLTRTTLKALAALVPVLLACLATAPAPLTDCPGALWALTAAHRRVCCPQMQVWPQTATATAAPVPALITMAGPSPPQTSLSCPPPPPAWGRALFRWMLNSAPFVEGDTEEGGPSSAPASLLPPRCSPRSPSPLVHLDHSAAHRPRSPAPAPPPATAPATVRAATALSHLREPPSQGPPRLDAASGTSGPDLILATGSKVRCELIVSWQTFYADSKVIVLIKPWFNWLNTCEPTSGYLLGPEKDKLPLAWWRMDHGRPSWGKLECLLTQKTGDNHCRRLYTLWVATILKTVQN